MDMANFTIQQIRPYLQQQSMEYEKAKFEEFLKTQRGEILLIKGHIDWLCTLIPKSCS